MGYSHSSHYFNKVVQKHLEDISKVHVEVDDLLTEGHNHEEAINTFRQVLERCREKNIKLARHKLEVGQEVDFTGIHIGGPQGFRPTQVKIDALINLSPPSNLTELRHFIGCWNQMRDYLPNYTHSMTNLNSLLKKDVPFIWVEPCS